MSSTIVSYGHSYFNYTSEYLLTFMGARCLSQQHSNSVDHYSFHSFDIKKQCDRNPTNSYIDMVAISTRRVEEHTKDDNNNTEIK